MQDLFASYKALPEGPKRRAMASRLIQSNEALIQHTIDSLTGRKTLSLHKPFGGCTGLSHVDRDDAMQAGRIAFAKALDYWKPEKGKFQYVLLLHARHQLQKMEIWHGVHLIHVPEAHVVEHRKHVQLFGSPRDLDNAADRAEARGVDYGDATANFGVTPEDLEEWAESGDWPDTIEELEARMEA